MHVAQNCRRLRHDLEPGSVVATGISSTADQATAAHARTPKSMALASAGGRCFSTFVVGVQTHTVVMRTELEALLEISDPIVVVTGDSGTGKSSILLAHQKKLASGTTLAPPPITCSFDSGALQVAILNSLVNALVISTADRTAWRQIQHRFEHASKEMAVEIGKGLAKAVAQEVMAQVKQRLGEHAGEGIAAFFRNLRQDPLDELRRDLQSRSDTNVVKLLTKLCDEVAAALSCDMVLAIDECQRLTDDDQRALASLSLSPPKRARFVIAWSSAAHAARDGLDRLREANCREVVVGGLSMAEIESLLASAGLASSHAERVLFLSDGFPLIIEGLLNQLRSGETLDSYTPPTAFVRALEDALDRLPANDHLAARKLSVFELPLSETTLAEYLQVSATEWGVLRHRLERERILSVERNGQLWFHESRRTHLWNELLSQVERLEIGQPAYVALLAQYREELNNSAGLVVPIANVAQYAKASQSANPMLAEILLLTPAQLAVLASTIELEISNPGDGVDCHAPSETVLIYAHTFFGADRGEALDALPNLLEHGFITTAVRPGLVNVDPDVACAISDDPTDECHVVLNGRIQGVLGKTAIQQVTGQIVHEHFDTLRQESTIVLTQSGRSDTIDLIRSVLHHPINRFNPINGTVYPMLALWVNYGGHVISLAAVFNNITDRNKAKKSAAAIDAMSYGRRVRTVHSFEDQRTTVPSTRFFRAIHWATGRPVEANKSTGRWWMKNEGPPLSVTEYAQRQIMFLSILTARAEELEHEVYALDEPRGAAVGQAPDGTYLFVELRGSTRVIELDSDHIELLQSNAPFKFARLENLLPLGPRERTKKITERVQSVGLIDDPVVSILEELWETAREFNKHQPKHRVKLQKGTLEPLLREAHLRDTTLARELSERLTIGGERGHRQQHALRVAIHPGDAETVPPLVAYTYPVGSPTDVQVRFLARSARPEDLEQLYFLAFGEHSRDELYGDAAHPTIADLLGFGADEIKLAF